MMFQRLSLAVGFSPRTEALLAEAARLCIGWKAKLTVVHVGSLEPEKITFLKECLLRFGLTEGDFNIYTRSGDPAKVIIDACRENQTDLLIAGALQREKLIKYYLGTVGRTLLRKAPCSVLMLTDPQATEHRFEHIVALAEDTPYIRETLQAACATAAVTGAAWLHILRELKMYGLSLTASEQSTEEEYTKMRHQLVRDEIDAAESLLSGIPHTGVRVNIKVVSGKAGFEVSKFAELKEAELIVVGAPERRFNLLDRFFSNDLEYLFADLPCNLMMVKPPFRTAE